MRTRGSSGSVCDSLLHTRGFLTVLPPEAGRLTPNDKLKKNYLNSLHNELIN